MVAGRLFRFVCGVVGRSVGFFRGPCGGVFTGEVPCTSRSNSAATSPLDLPSAPLRGEPIPPGEAGRPAADFLFNKLLKKF